MSRRDYVARQWIVAILTLLVLSARPAWGVVVSTLNQQVVAQAPAGNPGYKHW